MTPLPQEGVKKGEQVKNPSRAYEIRGYSPISSLSGAAGGGGLNTPPPGTPVERLIDGQWLNGWVVHDGANPHAVTIAKLGQSTYRIRNLRWDVDVRCCTGSPFPTPQPPVNQQPEEEEGQSLSPPGRSLPQPEDQDQPGPSTTFDF